MLIGVVLLAAGWYQAIREPELPQLATAPEVSVRTSASISAPVQQNSAPRLQLTTSYISQTTMESLLERHPATCFKTGPDTVSYDNWVCVRISDKEWRCDRVAF